jgi:hypothetical protein
MDEAAPKIQQKIGKVVDIGVNTNDLSAWISHHACHRKCSAAYPLAGHAVCIPQQEKREMTLILVPNNVSTTMSTRELMQSRPRARHG